MNWIRWNSPPISVGEGLDGHRLGQAGHALDEEVTAGEQRDDHPLEQVVLADDGPLDLVERLLQRVRVAARWWPGPGPVGLGHGCSSGRGHWAGAPAPPPAVAMGTANPIPTKKPCWLGFARPVTIPTTWPALLSSGPPELPGFTAASNWIRCSSF